MGKVTCERCGATYEEERGDGYCGFCPSCADATDNCKFYDAIFNYFEERYGDDFIELMGDETGEVDDVVWRFIDEVTDLTERTIFPGNEAPK